MPSTPMNAGLPQPAASTGLPIGVQLAFGAGGFANNAPTITLDDGSIWLKRNAFARANLFPSLAKIERYATVGAMDYSLVTTLASGFALNTSLQMWAHDSVRNITLALSASGAEVLRSTDGGATWARIALPSGPSVVLGMAVNPNNRLVVMALLAGAVRLYYSTDGSAFTLGATVQAGATTGPNTGGRNGYNNRLCWTGTQFAGCYEYFATPNYEIHKFTSADGTTAANDAAVSPSLSSASSHGSAIDSDGAGNVAIIYAENSGSSIVGGCVSTDNGATYTTVTTNQFAGAGATGGLYGVAVISGKAFFSAQGGSSSGTYVVPSLAAPTAYSQILSAYGIGSSNGSLNGGALIKTPGNALYLFNNNSLLKFSPATYDILQRRNMLRGVVVPLPARVVSSSDRAPLTEVLPVSTSLDATDSVGFYGQIVAAPGAGDLYVKAK